MSSANRPWIKISASIAFIVVILALSSPLFKNGRPSFILSHSSEQSRFHAPRQNVWADLEAAEASSIVNFMLSSSELNLTDTAKATSDDNSILLVELLQPNKSDVLSYFDGSSGPPTRFARVVVEQGATEKARVMNYMVGPLPLDETTKVLPLEYCYSSGRSYALNALAYRDKIEAWAKSFLIDIVDIVEELLIDDQHPFDEISGNSRLAYIEGDTLMLWMQFYRKGLISDATSLLPQGLYVQLNVSTRDIGNWKMLQWYYNNQLYANESSFRDAMSSQSFKKSNLNIDGHWADLEDFESSPSGRSLPPPAMIQPSGSRFKVDKREKFVSWMGYEFFMSTTSNTGLALHNINYNGDSVMHELSLQEALAHYAGDDPMQGGQEFLDVGLYMGMYMYELVPGYDCPAYAAFLDTEYHFGGETKKFRNSICVFEYTADHALQRHTSSTRVSISRNTYLVVRFVSTVWNYDYTFDYIFYLDGTIEVKVRASGFIFGAFWTGSQVDSHEDEYGFRVRNALSTSMHDHVINFKADLDVAGPSNTMMRIGIEPLTKSYPWDDEKTNPRNTMHLVKSVVDVETGIDWPSNSGEMLIVVNDNESNKWGEKRGYKIMPGTGIGSPVHLSILNSTTLGKAAEWAAKDIWILKRKDTEPMSSSPLNALSPLDPIVDFSKFVDDEDIVDEDLVIFFNLGTHHVPHSGDIPNTLMHTSSSSVMFAPFNFHDADPSIHTRQGVKMEHGREPKYFGATYQEGTTLEKVDLEPDMNEYRVPVDSGTNHSFVYKVGGPAPWE